MEEVHVSLIDDNEVDYVVLTKNPVWSLIVGSLSPPLHSIHRACQI